MRTSIPTTGLVIAFACTHALAKPGGTYTLTGREKNVAEIITSDMEQYPELYKGESLNGYIYKFKKENRIGKRKLAPGDVLVFPETDESIKRKTPDDANPETDTANLYGKTGTDPLFQSLLDSGTIPVGENSRTGVEGSMVDVNNAIVERGANGKNPIPQDIKIHTLCNSSIRRNEFDRWTRWYQEDGNTQVFRLFKGEYNVRNSRPGAARIEAFSELQWKRGDWHEWEGTYTIVKPHACAIFQAKNGVNDWGVMINLLDNGSIMLNHRRHQADIILAEKMTGKSFDLKVRDNGHDYEVYFNGEKVGTGYYDRPEGYTIV